MFSLGLGFCVPCLAFSSSPKNGRVAPPSPEVLVEVMVGSRSLSGHLEAGSPRLSC